MSTFTSCSYSLINLVMEECYYISSPSVDIESVIMKCWQLTQCTRFLQRFTSNTKTGPQTNHEATNGCLRELQIERCVLGDKHGQRHFFIFELLQTSTRGRCRARHWTAVNVLSDFTDSVAIILPSVVFVMSHARKAHY